MKYWTDTAEKAELHLHLEGTLEPEFIFRVAQRNQISLPYQSLQELKAAYSFDNLQDFLNLYFAGSSVLYHAIDFYEMTWEYLQRCKDQNIVHLEAQFDLQSHLSRGVSMDVVFEGICSALDEGRQKLGIQSGLILTFLRDRSEEEAITVLRHALAHRDKFQGIGLVSSELGHPPRKFKNLFEMARGENLFTVAHAGEEGPPEYIRESLDILHVARIDHGVRCLEDPDLVRRLVDEQIPLAVCPISNVLLKVFDDMSGHNILELLRLGVRVSVNCDDPGYFGSGINENFTALFDHLGMSDEEAKQLIDNAFESRLVR